MRKGIGTTCVATLLSLVAAPAMAQTNLILNGGFDVIAGSGNPNYPDDPVNARIWFGDYIVDGFPPPPEEGWGSRAHVPDPNYQSPLQIWEASTGGPAESSDTWQTVAVSPGATVTFTGYIHTGPDADTTERVTITLYDGSEPGGTVIDSVVIDESGASSGWLFVDQHPAGDPREGDPIGGMAGSGHVTVRFQVEVAGTTAAVHLDDFSLTSSVACATQHTLDPVTPIEPAQGEQYVDATVTINGTNMQLVTGVKLIQVESQTMLAGTITDRTPSTLTVYLPLVAQSAPPGDYTLVTEQEDCVGQTAVDAFHLLPAVRENVLLNSSFESDDLPGPPPHADPWPDHWIASNQWEPVWTESWPHTGIKAVAAYTNGGGTKTETVEQSVGLPAGPGTYDLELTFWAFLYDDYGWPGPAFVKGEIIVDSTTVASDQIELWEGETPYTLVTVPWAGTANSDITAKITLQADAPVNWSIVAVDDVELGIPVALMCHKPFADVDSDHDIDQEDFAVFQACYTGANQGPVPSEPDYCRCLDVEGPEGSPDHDIDGGDLAEFENCATGPEITLDPEDPGTWPPGCLVDP